MAEQLPFLPQKGGFNFDLYARNQLLEKNGAKQPTSKKTGTTIAGIVFKDGIILGADTRATEGPIVCDKNCEKIHYIAPNIWCCGAGTSADTENSTGLISSQLELHRLSTGRQSRVVTAMTMLKRMLFKYQGHVSAALVLGGVDCTGPSLYTIYPHGSTDKLPYVTMGSGSLAAMAVFEARYKDNMERQEAIDLVHAAICAGIFNDLGSGGNVDLCVITKEGVDMLRNYDKPNERKYRREKGYHYPRGTTAVLKKEVAPLSKLVTVATTTTPLTAQSTAMEM
jgi:20S proteasome subunit beta 2